MKQTRSTCPYCGVGCGVIIESEGDKITGVRGDPEHPANFGRLCSKGQALHFTAAPELLVQVRALHPMRRTARGGPLERVSWNAALDEAASRLAAVVERHGPDAIGLYLSGQLLTEDYYVFNKLGKGFFGTNNVDTNSRLCMSSAVAGYKQSLGADSVPACYDDIALADTVFVTGSNMAWAHPVLYRRLEDARRARPGMKVIVVDPRRTETAAEADLHLQIQPGTDVVLHHAMLHVMLWEGLTDAAFIAAHTTGFGTLRERVREFTPAHAAQVCGVKADHIVTAARWFAGLADGAASHSARRPTLSLWCQGLNQSTSGTDRNSTLINLHLATGQIGKPGAGPLSLTGQPNAMGGREVGGLANLLSAHRDLANAEHRAEVARLWGVPDVPAAPGKTAVEMFRAAAEGEVRALWIVCTNPAQSLPDQALVRRALERCEFVIVQEAYRTAATVAYADLLLPASSWGEKEGTVTNSERRISRVRAAVDAPGEARADWQIAADVACRIDPRRGRALFPYASAEAVWNEHRESTRGRDLDITGLSYAALEQPQQWPRREGEAKPTPRLYADGRFATDDGRARFVAPAWRGVAEPRDAHYPVALTTGRLRDQWHGLTRTGSVARLWAHSPEPVVQMHPQELTRRHWRDGDLVRLRSRRGTLVLPVQASESVTPAQAFVAMHWGEEALPGQRGVNVLTLSAFCPQSKQPELKHAAVKVERAELPWELVSAVWLPAERAWPVREQVERLGAGFGFASVAPFGREPLIGLRLRVAAAGPVAEAAAEGLIAELSALFDLAHGAVLRYADARKGTRRALRIAADGTLAAYLLAGDTSAAPWMHDWLAERRPAAPFGRALLAAGAQPPAPAPVRGAVVCSCNGVGEAVLIEAMRAGADLAALQAATRCGTTCGSCLPAVKALARRHAGPAARAGAGLTGA
jgi:assimilatory nitrate reductase catalytic subunit